MLGLRPFDVQLIGGMILHEAQIAEMRTGEGKTLVAVLPAFLNALSGARAGARGGARGRAMMGRAGRARGARASAPAAVATCRQLRCGSRLLLLASAAPLGARATSRAFPHKRLPPCHHPPAGKGVHVVTVNDYLARRDSEWVGQVRRRAGDGQAAVWGQGRAGRGARGAARLPTHAVPRGALQPSPASCNASCK